jgi:hypothetical protein
MKLRTLFIASVISLFASTTPSYALDLQVQSLGDRFLGQLPAGWSSTLGTWEYFDVTKCFTTPGMICYGNNPTSPYGFPSFVPGSMNFQMSENEAVVLILRTPSQMRYFAFTQYLAVRPGETSPVFASLSDSLNHMKIGTTGSSQNGVNVFDSYTALVWTADQNTYQTAKNLLIASGLQEQAINFIPLPINLPMTTIKMGYGADKDTFNMLMRTAMPTIPAVFDQYVKDNPYYVMKVGPAQASAPAYAPVIGYSLKFQE